MIKKKSKLVRIDPEFEKWSNDIAIERVKRGLERETVSPREISRMILNTDCRFDLELELISKPRKK